MEESDTVTLRAMSNFQYHLAIENIDEAFKVDNICSKVHRMNSHSIIALQNQSIKIVNNTYVWENLAKMCVKMRNLQVARLCLGKVGNAKALRAIGQDDVRDDELAQLAVIGIYLGKRFSTTLLNVVAGSTVPNAIGLDEEVRTLCKEAERWDVLNTYCQVEETVRFASFSVFDEIDMTDPSSIVSWTMGRILSSSQ